MNPEFSPKESKFSKRKQTFRLNERLARRLRDIADRHYEGSEAAAIEGLLLYEWMVDEIAKKAGRNHDHWISAPLVLRGGELEPMLDRLEAGDADAVNAFIDVRIDIRTKQETKG